MKRLLILLHLTSSLVFDHAFAHGEDRPGPHGGVVRMPGPFHTEVLADGKEALKVFLLDVEFKNPTVSTSLVDVRWRSGVRELNLACTARVDHFRCATPPGAYLDAGELTLRAVRDGASANPATYPLPLRPSAGPTRGSRRKSPSQMKTPK